CRRSCSSTRPPASRPGSPSTRPSASGSWRSSRRAASPWRMPAAPPRGWSRWRPSSPASNRGSRRSSRSRCPPPRRNCPTSRIPCCWPPATFWRMPCPSTASRASPTATTEPVARAGIDAGAAGHTSPAGPIQRTGSRISSELRPRRPHGDELLGGGGVDAEGGVELGLGGAGPDRYRQPLDDLPRLRPHHVGAHHPVAALVDDELHQGALGVPAQRVHEGGELGGEYVDLPEPLPRPLLAVADGGHRRLAED